MNFVLPPSNYVPSAPNGESQIIPDFALMITIATLSEHRPILTLDKPITPLMSGIRPNMFVTNFRNNVLRGSSSSSSSRSSTQSFQLPHRFSKDPDDGHYVQVYVEEVITNWVAMGKQSQADAGVSISEPIDSESQSVPDSRLNIVLQPSSVAFVSKRPRKEPSDPTAVIDTLLDDFWKK